MNPIEKLSDKVRVSFPRAQLKLDPAKAAAGAWFLDVDCKGYYMTIEWRKGRGFALTAGRHGEYGEGADETYPDLGSALRRVLWLLHHRAATVPALADQLRRMRARRRVTQEELARRLGVKQSSISKLEGRGDAVSLRKLQEFLAAMGGQLRLGVSFPDSGEEEFLSLGELHAGAAEE